MPNKNPFPWVPRRWVNTLFPWLRWSMMHFYSFIFRSLAFLPSLTRSNRSKISSGGEPLSRGSCISVNIGCGIPKTKVKEALVTPMGLLGDSQAGPYIAIWGGHAGFNKAVMLWSSEVISEINAIEGKEASFFYGASGEQLTLSGVDWSLMKTGVRVAIGAQVLLEVTLLKGPCKNLDRYFSCPADKVRIDPKKFPDSARILAKVLVPGKVSVGDEVLIFQHPDGEQPLQIQA